MTNKQYFVLNAVGLVVTIFINYLSNTGIFCGNTMKTVSDAYFNRFTPAGYAFSIWGLIYLSLAGFIVYTGVMAFKGKRVAEIVEKIGWWFVLSCLANSLWVFAWLCEYTLASVAIMLVLLISLLAILQRLDLCLTKVNSKNYIFISLPFSLYAGWISLAIIANVAALLTKIQWNGFGVSDVYWAIIMIVVAGLLNIFMVLKRSIRAFGAVGIWGLLAIAANQYTGGQLIIYCSYAFSGLIFLVILFDFFKPVSLKKATDPLI